MPSPLKEVGGELPMQDDKQASYSINDLPEETTVPYSDKDVKVHIVGPLKLQNELMRGYLEKETGLACVCCEARELAGVDVTKDKRSVILWDCLNITPVELWNKLEAKTSPGCYVALFNVSTDQVICQEAVNYGVRGIFFEGDSPGIFQKGVKAILNKELWFPRETLAKCLLEERGSNRLPQRTHSELLTPREKEILIMIASGSSNGKIANDLCISPNTVKTHIYNIYNKINVPNRLQAALWASKNL